MAVTVTERQDSRRYTGGENPSWEFSYNVEGTDDCIQARLELVYHTSIIFDGLVRQTPHLEYQGPSFWIASVTYGKRAPVVGRLDYQFEIGGGTEKRLQSIATRKYPATASEYNGAIGVRKSGDTIDVEGQDVYVPSKSFSLKWTLNAGDFTPTLERNLYLMAIAPVNIAPWLGYDAGELLFLGATGGVKQGDETGELTLKFQASPNLTNLSVGDVSAITKGGWELVDIVRETEDAEEGGTKFLRPKIAGVYVHQVYNQSNFSALLGF
jgi:hypothetical protein